jgi:hypothetical protein
MDLYDFEATECSDQELKPGLCLEGPKHAILKEAFNPFLRKVSG